MLRWCDLVLRAGGADRAVRHSPRLAARVARRVRLRRRASGAPRRADADRVAAARLRRNRARGVAAVGSVESGDDLQDIKHALRSLRRKPSFTAVVVLTLAIGIGGTTAIFGAVNAVLLRPLPYPQPDQLVQRLQDAARGCRSRSAARSRRRTSPTGGATTASFTELAAINGGSLALTGLGAAEQVPAGDGDRRLLRRDGHRAAARTHHHHRRRSDGLARRRRAEPRDLAAALRSRIPRIIGQQVALDGVSHEVIGVMPRGFQYPLRSEMWVPLRFSARDLETQRGAHYIDVVGRLKPDVSLERAREDMRAIAARLAREFPRTNRDYSASRASAARIDGQQRPAIDVRAARRRRARAADRVRQRRQPGVDPRASAAAASWRCASRIGAGRATLVRSLLVESLAARPRRRRRRPGARVLGDDRDRRRSIRRSACRC